MNCHQLIPFVAYINIATNKVLHNIKSNKSSWNERDIVFQTSCEEIDLNDIIGIHSYCYCYCYCYWFPFCDKGRITLILSNNIAVIPGPFI